MSGFEVAGIDLSLTSTGIARACWDRADHRYPEPVLMVPFTRRVQSKAPADVTLAARQSRLDALAEQVTSEVYDAQLVAIEGPSFGQTRQAGQHDRAGLWWIVVDRLIEHGATVVEIPPSLRSMYATGRGNAPKDHVLAAAIKRYPTWDITGNDIADAVVLAAIGARGIGRPIEDGLPKTHLRALDKLRFPTLERTPA